MARYQNLHGWDVSPPEAILLQQRLRERVRIVSLARPVQTIAGADISFNKFSTKVYAAIVVLRLPSLVIVEEATAMSETHFPYIPGLLSFREVPALLEAWAKLRMEPDAVMLDGQGIAHPRRMGIAAHFGLFIERPTLGCAKSVLAGKYAEPSPERGAWTPMMDKGETIGAALRTKNNVQPIFVSPGHQLDLMGAIQLASACNGGYRIPEPTRRAHHLANALRRTEKQGNMPA